MRVLIQGETRRCTLEAAEMRAIVKAEAALQTYAAEMKCEIAKTAAAAVAAFITRDKGA